jgi:hypothetical protein
MSMLLVLCLASVAGAGATEASLPETVTFTEHVAPIVFAQCTSCHRPGEAAPFPLMNYNDTRKHARTIARVVGRRYMPPWQPEPGYGDFRGERRLSDREIALVKKWVDSETPEGDPAKLPKLPEFQTGWQVGKPDLIVKMEQSFEVPADGPDIYRNFVLPLNLTEDRWVKVMETRSSTPAVVHHIIYQIDNSGRARKLDGQDGKPGFRGMGFRPTGIIGGWAVGAMPQKLPDDLAFPLPKGSDLVLQVHFHPSGKVEKCQITAGIRFADKAPSRTLLNVQLPPVFGVFSRIDIPAGVADFTVRDSFTLPVDVDLVGASAHAHYLGKSLKAVADLPDKTTKNLFWIKDWDFNWQGGYFYKDYVRLPKGTVLRGEVIWDNSADNKRNPHVPPIRVKWGEGTNDEMGSVRLLMVAADEKDTAVLRQAIRDSMRNAAITAIRRGDKLPLGALGPKAESPGKKPDGDK